MTSRRAITWATVRTLVCGVLLTLAAAMVDDVRKACGWLPPPESQRLIQAKQGVRLIRHCWFTSEMLWITNEGSNSYTPFGLLWWLPDFDEWTTDRVEFTPISRTVREGLNVTTTVTFSDRSVIAQGWPLRALALEINDTGMQSALAWRWGRWQVVMGMRPMWGGLVVDVVFFACIAGALEIGLRSALRCKRRRSGNCTSCGYSRTGLTPEQVCPECGDKA